MKQKDTESALSEKVDTKITKTMLSQIEELMLKEGRSKSNMLRVLLKRGIGETVIEPSINTRV